MTILYDDAAVDYNESTYTYDGAVAGVAAVATKDAMVFVRLTASTPKRLALVRSATGMLVGFGPGEGWEIVSNRFLMTPGQHDATMSNIRGVWIANRDASRAALLAALDAELVADGYTFPGGGAGAAPPTDS